MCYLRVHFRKSMANRITRSDYVTCINTAPFFVHVRIDDSPKAAMLSPYRCQCISLVSGLRSEYSSSSIGSSCALCSACRAAYQKHARGPYFFYPLTVPLPRAWWPEGWDARGLGNAVRTGHHPHRIAVPSCSIAPLPPLSAGTESIE